MRYISTRGATPALSFEDAVLTGLAPDGGLLLPETLPSFADRLDAWRGLPFTELAVEVFAHFADDIPPARLREILREAYATFSHPEVVPLVDLGELHVMELFHGPTLAFKDVALQVLGRLFEHIVTTRRTRLNVLCATSGDTGSAAIAGVRGRASMGVFVLYPEGRTSALQELQMTTVPDDNVHCIAIQGTFDDCQRIVKAIFNDLDFKARHGLGAANSVNWARVLAQAVYYLHGALRFDEPVSFSVPTGNFGNILAGYLARAMGAPIDTLVLGTNDNDILARFFETGVYSLGETRRTISPSMDIQVASNFERFVYYRLGCDPGALNAFMTAFASEGAARIDGGIPSDEGILATAVDEPATFAAMADLYARRRYVVDPHTAVGVAAAQRFADRRPMICLAAAHPAKFPDAVNRAAGEDIARHPMLDGLRGQPERKTLLPPDTEAVKAFIAPRAGSV